MSNVSIESVKELRAKTHFGMTDCKNALVEAEGDLGKAVEILQRKGLRKLDTVIESLEGEVRAYANGNRGSIVEVNCQTDFAARSELFQKFMSSLGPEDSFQPVSVTSGFVGWHPMPQIEAEKKSLSVVLGENVQIRRVDRLVIPATSQGLVFAYNHPGGRIAVLVSVVVQGALPTDGMENVRAFAEHVAMHIAATNPSCVHRTEVPVDMVQKQKELLTLDLPQGKKPEQLEKILEGKMNRWFGETVLSEQTSVVDPATTIAKAGSAVSASVLEFRRFERGESISK